MNNIPSNFSFEEVVKYSNIPELIRLKLDDVLLQIHNLETELAEVNKQNERLNEQVYFRNEFITSVMEQCNKTTRHKVLVKGILTELENSYIEL